jgi:hypothetical protein
MLPRVKKNTIEAIIIQRFKRLIGNEFLRFIEKE